MLIYLLFFFSQATFKSLAPDHFSHAIFNNLRNHERGITRAKFLVFIKACTDVFITHDWGKRSKLS